MGGKNSGREKTRDSYFSYHSLLIPWWVGVAVLVNLFLMSVSQPYSARCLILHVHVHDCILVLFNYISVTYSATGFAILYFLAHLSTKCSSELL